MNLSLQFAIVDFLMMFVLWFVLWIVTKHNNDPGFTKGIVFALSIVIIPQLLFLLYVSFKCNENARKTSNLLLILLFTIYALSFLLGYILYAPFIMFLLILIMFLPHKCAKA